MGELGAAVDECARRRRGLAGPPYEAEFATYSGGAGCVSSWYAHHPVRLTTTGSAAGRLIAGPLGLSNLGCNFTVYLRP